MFSSIKPITGNFGSLVNISAKDSHVHFEIPKGGAMTVPYDGEISGDTISGTFQNGKFNGAFTLKRITPQPLPYKGGRS